MKSKTDRTVVIEIIEHVRSCEPHDRQLELVDLAIKKLNKKRERYGRASTRMDVVLILILVAVSTAPAHTLSLHNVLVFVLVFLVCVGLIVWFRWALPKWNAREPVVVREQCYCCGYSLDGHASVLGDDVWVGPEVCPECGERYPAIG